MALTKVSTDGVKDGSLLNADINASAAIAGSKISPDFGSQVVTTTGDIRVGDTTDSNAGTQTISVGSVSSGSGGIGIFANPTNGNSFLQFGDGTAAADQYRGFLNYQHASDSLIFGSAGSERMRITSTGKVNIGDTQMSSNLLNVEDGTAAAIDFASHGSGGDTAYIGVKKSTGGGLTFGISNRDIIFKTGATYNNGTTFDSGTERMRIDSSGRLLLGTTSTTGISVSADDIIIGSIGDSTSRGITFATTTDGTIRWADAGDNAMGRIQYLNNTDVMTFHTSNAPRLRLDSDGMKFGSDTAAANALDDYEEGTFSATVHSGGTVSSFSQNKCSYTKIGRFVYFQIYLQINGTASGSHFQIGNLPFTSSSFTLGYGGANIHYQNHVFQNSGDTVIYFIQNSNVLAFYRNSGSTVNGNSGDIFGNRDFILTGAFVAA